MNDNNDKDMEFRGFLEEIAGGQPVGSSGEKMDYTQIEQPDEIIVDPALFDMLPYAVRELVDKNPEASEFAQEHPNLYVLVAALMEDAWLSINMSMVADSKISEEEKREQLGSLIYSAMTKVVTEDEDLLNELANHGEQIATLATDIIISTMIS